MTTIRQVASEFLARKRVAVTDAEYGREHGITVIDGSCPCLLESTAAFEHRAMRLIFTLGGNVPRRV